jgi:hypothetical protein
MRKIVLAVIVAVSPAWVAVASSPISHVKTFQNQKRCIVPLMLILALNMAQGSSRSRARLCALRSAGALVSKLEAHGANSSLQDDWFSHAPPLSR